MSKQFLLRIFIYIDILRWASSAGLLNQFYFTRRTNSNILKNGISFALNNEGLVAKLPPAEAAIRHAGSSMNSFHLRDMPALSEFLSGYVFKHVEGCFVLSHNT